MVSKLSNQNLYRQLRIKHNFLEQHLEDVEQEDQIEIEDCNKLNQEQLNQASIYVDNMRRNFQPGHILQSMDLILFHSETDMPIYVEKGSPYLKSCVRWYWLTKLLTFNSLKIVYGMVYMRCLLGMHL